MCTEGRSTIDVLSDDALLCIFDFYRQILKRDDDTWPWHVLVQVYQRWRYILFAWPLQLDLRLHCKSRTAVAKAQTTWPALPITLQAREDGDGMLAALKGRDRVVRIDLSASTRRALERCAALMQEPFPFLRSLFLRCNSADPPVITDSFLGGSAPRLQIIDLRGVPFPTLPKLLLSACYLVHL